MCRHYITLNDYPVPLLQPAARKHHEAATCRKIIVLIILPFFFLPLFRSASGPSHRHCCRDGRRHNRCPTQFHVILLCTQWFCTCKRVPILYIGAKPIFFFWGGALIFYYFLLINIRVDMFHLSPFNRKLREFLNINTKYLLSVTSFYKYKISSHVKKNFVLPQDIRIMIFII